MVSFSTLPTIFRMAGFMKSTSNKRIIFGLAFFAVASATFCLTSQAQETYKADPIDPEFVEPNPDDYDMRDRTQKSEYTKLRNAARSKLLAVRRPSQAVSKGTADLSSNVTAFDRFFKNWYIPAMTQTDDASLSNLGEMRKDLLYFYVRPATNAVRTRLLQDILFPNMTRIVEDAEYHPAVRSNAMIIISELNEVEGNRTRFPVPYAQSATYMTAAIDKAELPSYLRLLALGGVYRHATVAAANFDASTRGALQTKLLALVNAGPAKAGETQSAEDYWARRRAIQILGAFGQTGNSNEVGQAIAKVIADEKEALWLRCSAVEAYGKLRFNNASEADVDTTTKSIAKYVSTSLRDDSKYISDYIYMMKEKEMLISHAKENADGNQRGPGNKGMGGMPPGKGGAGSRPQQPQQQQQQRPGRGRLGALDPGDVDGNSGEGSPVNAKAESGVAFPNYRLNLIKQRVKTIVYSARVTLGGTPTRPGRPQTDKGLAGLTSDADQVQMLNQLVAKMDEINTKIEFEEKRRNRGFDDLVDGNQKTAMVDRVQKLLDESAAAIDKIAKLEPAVPESTPAAAETADATDSKATEESTSEAGAADSSD